MIKNPFYHYDEYALEQCRLAEINIKECKCLIRVADKHLGKELFRREIESTLGEDPQSIKESVSNFYSSLTKEEDNKMQEFYKEAKNKCYNVEELKEK